MNRKKWYCLVLVFCCLVSVSAQNNDSLKKVPAQVSFVYPLGTQGKQSKNFLYNFSFNILTGKVGGVNGLEISGLYGKVENDILGFQVSGLGNAVGGKMNGMQVSGLANIIGDEAVGMQTAGIINIVGDGMSGMQTAGLVNIIGDKMIGMQTAGIINIVGDGMSGMQTAGLVNIVGDDAKGLQVGGLANIVGGEMKGLQVSGLANVAGEEMKGVQISLYNRAHTSKGLQIGLVSVNDTIANGVSLSLINIVKKGAYKELELSFSDYANVALSFKMGTQKFYTIYTVGANFIEDNLFAFGIGFGNRTSIGKRFDFQPEFIYSSYFPTDFKNIQNANTTRLKLGFVYRLNENFGLSLAPSVYVLNADKGNNSDSEFYKTSSFGSLYTHNSNNSQTTIGVVSVGLNFRIMKNFAPDKKEINGGKNASR